MSLSGSHLSNKTIILFNLLMFSVEEDRNTFSDLHLTCHWLLDVGNICKHMSIFVFDYAREYNDLTLHYLLVLVSFCIYESKEPIGSACAQCVHTHTHTHTHYVCVYIYTYTIYIWCVCVCVYIYIYICTWITYMPESLKNCHFKIICSHHQHSSGIYSLLFA